MNSTAAILDLITLEVMKKIPPRFFFFNHYHIVMQNQVEIHFYQPFDPKLHKGLHYVFNFVNIMQTNDPETIGNLAKFIFNAWIKTIGPTRHTMYARRVYIDYRLYNIIIVFYHVNVYILCNACY